MKICTPEGAVYRVTRRWVPWQRKSRKLEAEGSADFSGFDGGDDPISFLLALTAAFVLIPLLAGIVFVFLVTGIELMLLIAILPFAITGRVVFGRHWTVEVRRGFTPIHEERTGSWTTSGVRIRELAREIESGNVPANTLARP
ncbi:hypothetical protein [Nocardioides luteus]|uniref:hypothetical protein n=1 Tax=Nocardioides luteus TaxID=1844 RepID=UPI0018C9E6B0|nr:hypothetical protein [Nocardioides luteus]MBG6098394.1 hypothetical protein [Nocardioides luteus]